MTGLLDIAKSEHTVPVQGKEIPVYGVSARGFASLFARFPDVAELFQGRDVEFTPQKLIELVPDAIAAIISAGTGEPGNKEVEEVAARLPAGDQLLLIEKIVELTMPQGVGPFVDRLQSLAGVAGVQSIGDRGQQSQRRSSNSSRSDTTPVTSGPTPQGNSQDTSSSPLSAGDESAPKI